MIITTEIEHPTKNTRQSTEHWTKSRIQIANKIKKVRQEKEIECEKNMRQGNMKSNLEKRDGNHIKPLKSFAD